MPASIRQGRYNSLTVTRLKSPNLNAAISSKTLCSTKFGAFLSFNGNKPLMDAALLIINTALELANLGRIYERRLLVVTKLNWATVMHHFCERRCGELQPYELNRVNIVLSQREFQVESTTFIYSNNLPGMRRTCCGLFQLVNLTPSELIG